MAKYIDADNLNKLKFHPLHKTYIKPTGADVAAYKQGWNDAIDAIAENEPAADIKEIIYASPISDIGKIIDSQIFREYCSATCMTLVTDEFLHQCFSPPKRGRWKKLPEGWCALWECSNCGETTVETVMGRPKYNYCPNCGAQMKQMEGNNDGDQ